MLESISKILAFLMAMLTTFMSFAVGLGDEGLKKIPGEIHIEETTVKPTEPVTEIVYKEFTGTIGEYTHKNVYLPDSPYEYSADMSVNLIGKTDKNIVAFKEKFASVYGYEPKNKVKCTLLGRYYVNGSLEDVYRYEISDTRYPLLVEDYYVPRRQVCSDGSAWVGFAAPVAFYEVDVMPDEVCELIPVIRKDFCEWTGISEEYMYEHPESFANYGISVAGKMRTVDGTIEDVIYVYIRGVNMPLDAEKAALADPEPRL